MKLFQSHSITSLRACGLAGLRACGLAALMWALLPGAASAQSSLIKGEYPGTISDRTDVRSPVSGDDFLGTGSCTTKIVGYEATATQFIVKTFGRPQNCGFTDLRFVLNGRAYMLDGLDFNFELRPNGLYTWKQEPYKSIWIWFNIGSRLAADALEKANGSFGVFEYMCRDNSCLTYSRIDPKRTESFLDIEAKTAISQQRQAMAKAEREKAQAAEAARKQREYENSPVGQAERRKQEQAACGRLYAGKPVTFRSLDFYDKPAAAYGVITGIGTGVAGVRITGGTTNESKGYGLGQVLELRCSDFW